MEDNTQDSVSSFYHVGARNQPRSLDLEPGISVCRAIALALIDQLSISSLLQFHMLLKLILKEAFQVARSTFGQKYKLVSLSCLKC